MNMAETEKKEAKKDWQRSGAGEAPEAGEKCKCPDGEGKIEEIKGHNVLVKLDSGAFWQGGIDSLWVMR